MGYAHYWRRVKEFDAEKFHNVVSDCTEIINGMASLGISIAGWDGKSEPELTPESISFNGLAACGQWPTENASGVGGQDSQVAGTWFVGATLQHRSCRGDCSHDNFILPLVLPDTHFSKPDQNGHYFDFCKTAYKPYDLAVIMCLLVAKHHLGDDIQVSSDGTASSWADGVEAVNRHFGYEVTALVE